MAGRSALPQETGCICFRTLSELNSYALSQYSEIDGELTSLITKLTGTMFVTGCELGTIVPILQLVKQSYDSGGRRSVSTMIKGWSNAIRSILACEPYRTDCLGYTKRAKNCAYALRRLGASQSEIEQVVRTYDGVCGIPPVLLLPPYWKILLGSNDISLFHKVIPLSNLGRACPIADEAKCNESIDRFFTTTGKHAPVEFDLTRVGQAFGELCNATAPQSRVPINSHSCLESSRDVGGKLGFFIEQVVNGYCYRTIDHFVPEKPASDLVDVFGNLVLRRDDWSVGAPITDVMYADIRKDVFPDGRLGYFALDWAIRYLAYAYPGTVISNSPYLTFGSFTPDLHFVGELPSKVEALAEEGYKSRVITIVSLAASIIQGVARFFLDNSVRTDEAIKIGLLSKVKLYDFMVRLSNGRRGVDNFRHPSYFSTSCVSADLTTATDTPYRLAVETLLRGFVSQVSRDNQRNFLVFAVDTAVSTRVFEHERKPSGHTHRCGIMMGEGLSGTYLNVMSGVVRCMLHGFMDSFAFYSGKTVTDAHLFIQTHRAQLQSYFDGVVFHEFHPNSTQSGDDLIFFSHHNASDLKRFLILLYVAFGEVPSENTFYSSGSYGTFTEEAIVKFPGSNGWTFVDCVKPRLYAATDPGGAAPVLSRIGQIVGTLKYVDDEDYILRACQVVDAMIDANPMIRDRIKRYRLPLGLPSFLGGIDHPMVLLPETIFDVSEEDRSLVMKLLNADASELFRVKYSWAFDDLPDDDDAKEIRESLIHLYNSFVGLPQARLEDYDDIIDLHLYDEEELSPRLSDEPYTVHLEKVRQQKSKNGLVNLDELVTFVASAMRFKFTLSGSEAQEGNPLVQLRNRREKLMKETEHLTGDHHCFEWSSVDSLKWRLQTSFNGKCVLRDSFLELFGFDAYPSLLIS